MKELRRKQAAGQHPEGLGTGLAEGLNTGPAEDARGRELVEPEDAAVEHEGEL